MKSLIKYITFHILCGVLGVYLAGIADRLYDYKPRVAPIGLIFITGPVGLFLSTGVLTIY